MGTAAAGAWREMSLMGVLKSSVAATAGSGEARAPVVKRRTAMKSVAFSERKNSIELRIVVVVVCCRLPKGQMEFIRGTRPATKV